MPQDPLSMLNGAVQEDVNPKYIISSHSSGKRGNIVVQEVAAHVNVGKFK
jgi:hypothetical protein